jgi:outer membrane protein TolC
VPLFDAGVRAASRDSARARLDAAQAAWAGRVRDAVREVEEALLRLEAAARQTERTDVAAAAYRRSLGSVQARRVAGFASDVDLEEARRIALAAESALLALAHERVQAWIALYRAAGGGWSPQPQDVRR